MEMTGGAYSRLSANSRLGTNSKKNDIVFFLFAFIWRVFYKLLN